MSIMTNADYEAINDWNLGVLFTGVKRSIGLGFGTFPRPWYRKVVTVFDGPVVKQKRMTSWFVGPFALSIINKG